MNPQYFYFDLGLPPRLLIVISPKINSQCYARSLGIVPYIAIPSCGGNAVTSDQISGCVSEAIVMISVGVESMIMKIYTVKSLSSV